MNNQQLIRALVFLISFGFLILSVEVFFEHYELLDEKKITLLPIIFGLVAGFIGLYSGIFYNKEAFKIFSFICVIGIIVGIVGTYFHNFWRYEYLIKIFSKHKEINFETLISYTPIFAPGAFSAMGLIGLIAMLLEKNRYN